jgi:hypothetical protein
MGQHRPTHFGDLFPGSQAFVKAALSCWSNISAGFLPGRTRRKRFLSQLCCDAPIRTNNGVSAVQHVWQDDQHAADHGTRFLHFLTL